MAPNYIIKKEVRDWVGWYTAIIFNLLKIDLFSNLSKFAHIQS